MPWTDLAAPFWPAADNFYRRRAEVRVIEDLPYAEGAHGKQRLDLFVPRGDGPFPAVVFFHGGFWKPQDRKLFRWLTGLYANVRVALALEGLAVAVPSYRQGSYADTERDALSAIAWLRAHGRERGVDVERLSLAGHSAGGNLALSLARDPERRAGPVCAVVSMCSVYDLPRLFAAKPAGLSEADARGYFGDDATMERLSPERHLGADATPALLVTSTGDDAALRHEHASFVKARREAGARCDELSVPDRGHMGVVMEMGRRRDRVTPAVASFVAVKTFEAGLSGVTDVLALLDGVFRPKRPRLDAVRDDVAGATTGAEAWARLTEKGLLPPSWSDRSARCFGAFAPCARCQGTGHGDHGGPCLACSRARIELVTPGDAPPSVAAAVAIASLSLETLTSLEALAWRSAEALAPWGSPPPWQIAAPTRVCWCAVPAPAWRRRRHQTVEPSRHASAACREAGRSDEALVRAFERALDARPARTLPAYEEAVAELESAVTWRSAVRSGLRVIACRDAPEGGAYPVGEAFSALADPFEARVAAWETGCAIDGVERDGTVVIVVPA